MAEKSGGKSKWPLILGIGCAVVLIGVVIAVVIGFMFWKAVTTGEGQKPLTKSDIEVAAKVLRNPEAIAELDSKDSGGFIAGMADKAKAKVVAETVKKGLEQLRTAIDKDNVSEGERAEKLAEIARFIQSVKVDENTLKMITRETINEAIRTYLKETTPEERVIYDPLVQETLEKLASCYPKQQ